MDRGRYWLPLLFGQYRVARIESPGSCRTAPPLLLPTGALQRRGGKGLIANNLTEKTGDLVTALSVHEAEAIMIVTKNGTMIRMPVDGVRTTGRSAQGVKLIDLDEGDVVMSATPVEPEDEEAPPPPAAGAAPEAPVENP